MTVLEIYYNDLTPAAQKEVLKLLRIGSHSDGKPSTRAPTGWALSSILTFFIHSWKKSVFRCAVTCRRHPLCTLTSTQPPPESILAREARRDAARPSVPMRAYAVRVTKGRRVGRCMEGRQDSGI